MDESVVEAYSCGSIASVEESEIVLCACSRMMEVRIYQGAISSP